MSEKQEVRPRRNNLGAWGWVKAGRYGLERYIYTLQRITGLGLLIFLLLHLFETSSRLAGAQAWERTMNAFSGPVFTVLEFIIMAAFVFHGLNGLRLFFEELGFFLGKPRRPIFPYISSMQRQRPFMYVMAALVFFFLILSIYDFFLA